MGLFKPFLVVILILLFLGLIGLIFEKQFTNYLIKSMDKMFYLFELEMKYPTQVSIMDHENSSELFLGMTADNLEFGIIPRGSISKRFMNLYNDDKENYKILLTASGNISPMVKFDKNDFLLTMGEIASVTVFLDSSLTSQSGNYTGEISIISKKPKFVFLKTFLGSSS